ncbi:hypothetical protein [Mesonia sp. HuA40]|uniref:hypothetical protein n=1 Tax=Mesonia sp. HuA40 TaxID=2602761 RepID=UPI0011CC3548|nr:hypothetical protein [Mesonia sp. HuA40]TXK73937.1 hypothetical protein FT993_03500 [Mesonia sp. HuA40]
MANFAITQHIPVANHVYKYLVKRCGSDTITANRNTFIGCLITTLHSRNNDLRKKQSVKKYTKTFNIVVPYHLYGKNGVYITEVNAQLFNTMIDRMFREEIYAHIMICNITNQTMFLKSLKSFLEIYEISEEDIKLETLYRDFKRKKEELENKLTA